MRILIDATSLLLRSAGVKSYTWHWLHHLRRLSPPGTIGAFPLLDESAGELDHERSVLPSSSTLPRLAALYLANAIGLPVVDWLCRGFDVFHASNQVRVPPRNARLTATLHDLTCWLMPELHTAANIRADASFSRNILQRVSGLIAVSENTRQDAIRVLKLDPDRIEVIHSGVDERFFHAKPLVRQRPYVLFLGTIEPRKNVDTLLDAWQALRPSIRDHFDLLVAGPPGWKSSDTLSRLQSGIANVHHLGYVPESEIPSLTAGATVFSYVSLYEGFGFPVAQAMAAGVPVVTSNTSCLPEIAGAGALCVDPRSPSEIATALDCLLSNPEKRTQLGAAGRQRASEHYRWEECARRSLEFFRRVMSR